MDFITRKFAFIYLKLSELLVNTIVWIYSVFHKQKNINKEIKSIGAYWYYPPDLTGSNLRLGAWKKHFEDKGYTYENLHINKLQEFVAKIENGTWTQKYLFFALNLWRRLPQILKAHHYDTIWIDRSLIPYYPRKTAFLEKCIKKVVAKMVVDTTDGGDYQGNPELMEGVLSTADEVTVGYKHLKKFYEDRFKVSQIFWTIPTEKYSLKKDYKIKDKTVIGWMGSPTNFSYVLDLLPILKEVSEENKFVFRYICRKNFDDQLSGIETEHHYFGDDYYDIISSFDIGISPFMVEDLRTKGKIAMKHQEFLLMGTPQICSPVALSEFVVNREHAIITNSLNEWKDDMIELMNSEDLRSKLGENSKLLFNQYYTFESQFSKLLKSLT